MSPEAGEWSGNNPPDGGATPSSTRRETPTRCTDGGSDTPSDDDVVRAAASAAEDLVFSRLDPSAVEDYDVTVTFEDAVLEVDVYVEAPDADADAERVADDAALAASGAVDDLFADTRT